MQLQGLHIGSNHTWTLHQGVMPDLGVLRLNLIYLTCKDSI